MAETFHRLVCAGLRAAIDSCYSRQDMRESADENAKALHLLDEEAPSLRAEVRAHSAKRWQEVQ
jgi:hypothetical protein